MPKDEVKRVIKPGDDGITSFRVKKQKTETLSEPIKNPKELTNDEPLATFYSNVSPSLPIQTYNMQLINNIR